MEEKRLVKKRGGSLVMDAQYGMCRVTHKSSEEKERGCTCVHTH